MMPHAEEHEQAHVRHDEDHLRALRGILGNVRAHPDNRTAFYKAELHFAQVDVDVYNQVSGSV